MPKHSLDVGLKKDKPSKNVMPCEFQRVTFAKGDFPQQKGNSGIFKAAQPPTTTNNKGIIRVY